ncbi:MAG: LacI family transcriptional regulator [Cellulomonas sp. 14-74-6]|nr:MAG: LacI family transcriptional regulator [Cellulomonas sp. 14-74-6]
MATPSGSGRGGRASIGDVARLAGVSLQTVSRVSNGSAAVRPGTRSRVLDAMTRLGYAPNHAARALRYGSFGAIGVVAHRLSRTGETRTVEAVVAAARREGFMVSLVDVVTPSPDDVSAAVQRLDNQAVDGLVVIRAETAIPETLALPSHLPVVVADSRFVGEHAAVGADESAGARAAVEHLLGLGHRRVHHVAGPAGSVPARLRSDAWLAACAAAGVRTPDPVPGDWTAASGYRTGRVLADDPAVTAVFCANDEMAVGLVRAMSEAGRHVPDDVSVVGFDDIPLAAYLSPPLTTVVHDFDRVGAALVDLLVRQLRGGEDLSAERVVVPAPLVIRASTAPPHGGPVER